MLFTLIVGSSRFVRNEVLTVAPLAYVTVAPAGNAVAVFALDELNSVSVGANRKNLMPF